MTARPAFPFPLLAACALFAAPAAGREPVKFADDPALSPDGATLAFAWRGDLWRVPVAGGTAARLTAHPAADARPRFSPDGTALAFDSDRAGSRQLYTMPAAGGTPRRVSGHGEGYTLQGWFPGGGALLAVGARDHHWRNADRFLKVVIPAEDQLPGTVGAAPDELLFDAYGTDGALSPDGTKLLYVREGERWWRKGYVGPQAAQVWLWDAADGTHTEVLRPPGGARAPLWRADGNAFHYVGRGVSDDGATAASPAFNLRAYDFFKRAGRALTAFPDDSVLNPAVAGETAVFRHLFDLYRLDLSDPEAGPVKIEIAVAPDDAPDPSDRRELDRASAAAVSADGLEWAFAAGGDIWVMDTVLKEPLLVTREGEDSKTPRGTAAWDTGPVFVGGDAKTGPETLLFVSETDGRVDLYSATRADPAKPWWRQSDFTIARLTDTPETEADLTVSPTGDRIAFVREPGELVVADPDGTDQTVVRSGFDAPDYAWGPDGRWIAAAWQDDDFNSEIYLLPADGSRPPVNVSRHPDDDGSPAFSPDGSKLAFVGRRDGDERDVHWLFLKRDGDDETDRDRTLAEALAKFDARKPKGGDEAKTVAPEDRRPLTAPRPAPRFDLENIHERLRTVSIPNSYEGGPFWLDDDTLAFGAYSADGRGTYKIDLPAKPGEKGEPKKLTGDTGSFLRRLGGGKAAWLSGGVPGTLKGDGKTEEYQFEANQRLAVAGRMRTGFGAAWRLMRDNWYDEAFNNRDWDAVRDKYLPAAGAAADPGQLGEVVSMMLGELNGSHLGFYPSGGDRYDAPGAWAERTGHLGLRFEDGYEGPGWKIRDVLPGGPADAAAADLGAGDIILRIDGVDLSPAVGPAAVLTGDPARDVTLTVRVENDGPRTLTLRPTSYRAARGLLYEHWLRHNREVVDSLSDGRFGYLHIRSMNGASLTEYERQLYNVGFGRDGLIVDVRDNGGGSTADRLLTSLTQPRHAVTVPRGGGPGYPQDRKVYASWHKPVVVLCNQNSYSNAEIFSHAIKTLGRGKLVGVRTAGGVISTGSAAVTDVGRIRQPFRGWYVAATGEDMELNGAVPHVELWPAPGDVPAGKDAQLEAAVAVLAEEVKKAEATPDPPLLKATARPNRPRYDPAE